MNFEDMVTRLARGWGDAASERECEEERLKFILPRREAPPPPPRYIFRSRARLSRSHVQSKAVTFC